MKMKEFMERYFNALYESMQNHSYSVEGGFNPNCCICPFSDMCAKANEEGDTSSCGEFILRNLSDGHEFRAK